MPRAYDRAVPDDDPRDRRYAEPSDAACALREIELPRGDVTEGLVRIGATVRRPHQPTSFAVAGYLDHLERAGFDGAPRYLGRDARGRDVLTYLDGCVPGDPPEQWATTQELLASVAELLRRLHDASAGYLADAGFAAPYDAVWHRDRVRVDVPDSSLPPAELISHCDVTPQNVVVRRGRAVGLVDFDMAGPASRLLDVVNTAMWWVPLRHPDDLAPHWRSLDVCARLRLFAGAYGLDRPTRERFVELAIARAAASRHRMRAAAEQLGGGWARMWEEGVGDAIARREQWLTTHRAALQSALHERRRA
jgi:Ser/Thr protein kinase RdoA (MazF antagonist)